MLAQDRHGAGEGFVEQAVYFLVDHLANALRVISLFPDVAPQEDHLLFATKCNGSKAITHAELGNHATHDQRRALDVISGARADFPEYDGLRRVAAESRGDGIAKPATRHVQPILLRQETRVART